MRRALIAAILLTGLATPAAAQDDEVDDRLERVERELRAVQRQIFPGGNPDFFEPEIAPAQPSAAAPGPGASAPIADLTERISGLESRVAELTNQVEENGFRLRQLEQRIEAMRATPPPPDPGFSQPGFTEPGVSEPGDRIDPPQAEQETFDAFPELPPVEDEAPIERPPADPLPPDAPIGTAGADPDLPADPGEASYVRGYRLWRDGDHAAAQAQLNRTIEEYPGDRFESYARNLLGRSLLDDGKPANAVEVFVANYRDLPNGERASDSLFYLGVALTALNYPDRACLAFEELQEVFGAGLRSDISEQLPAARRAAGCA